MKISIITASYNNKLTLEQTINSVLSQDYSNIEYIIVDGGSKDGTVKLVESYGRKIQQFISEPDKGIYDALNKGVKMATGDVVGFMHSDDFFASNDIVSNIARTFTNSNVDAVYGNLHYVGAEDSSKIVRNWVSSDFSFRKLRQGWMPPHPTLYIKNECYKKYGLYNTDLRIAADYELILRYFGKYQITSAYLPKTIVKMRLGGASNQSFKAIIKKMKEDYWALKNNNIGGVYTLLYKNFSKITQFINK
ncbi:glycosyltransferase [Flammeovirga yaeyamensis]|uniref:Glycosyltransferase n=1 Tax=Flammeovirga yaeyamensis TaxID=367791 RepID=A0AAX1N3I7_9BACT|nr:glycosyltransferase family 2 protein [Flammeovirga yaeyamensis]MBB3700969.1 glycosyltransferase [Flammeovirga yaeyamensis]NMF38076.1 glycosyltransferase [Flammeovirga yaeyamensis]QWG00725.1 glycosyltransferase [Flammeovirga yaeyamensis]